MSMAKHKREASKKKGTQKVGPPTQSYLDIAEIREDVVVMKDGTLRAVLMISSINFALKNEDEQQAIVQAYMAFLNAIDFPLQVVIHSRKMNIDPYMKSLTDAERATTNESLRTQITDYKAFVNELVVLGDIMEKKFYMVVPYDPKTQKKMGFFRRLSSVLSPTSLVRLKTEEFHKRKEQLDRRASILQGSLQSMSLGSERLDTQGLIELFYTSYNPDIFDKQRLVDLHNLRVEDHF